MKHFTFNRIFLFLFLLLTSLGAFCQSHANNKIEKYSLNSGQIVSLVLAKGKSYSIDNTAAETQFGTAKIAFKDGAQYTLKFNYYRAVGDHLRPLMFVLPSIIGETPVDHGVSATLASQGVDAIIVEVEDVFTTGKNLEYINQNMTQLIISIRLVADHFISNSNFRIDRNRLGIFGPSLGAVLAASIVGIADEFKYAYILAGAGDFAGIIQMTEQSRVLKFRDYVNSIGEMNGSNMEQVLNNAFDFDPKNFADRARIQGKRIHMVICKNDKVIGTNFQLKLWEAFGKQSYEEVGFYSHVGTIIRWFIKSRFHLADFIKN